MAEDPKALRDEILLATLANVAFDGWTRRALRRGVADLGLGPEMAGRAFPGGMAEVADHLADWADRRMLKKLPSRKLNAMRVRDRVAALVRARLEALAPHREAFRRYLSYVAMPQNAPLAARLTWRTVDAMWYAAGDEATDYNYYTKRALLASVQATTVLYWLSDDSDGFADTWAFLDRRITDVMRIPALTGRVKDALSRLPRPFRAFRRARG